jgi:hypothetical protein
MMEDITITEDMVIEATAASNLSVHAREILENPAYVAAKRLIRESMFDLFQQPDLCSAARESLWLYSQLFNQIDGTLAAIYNGGEAAKIILANLTTKE